MIDKLNQRLQILGFKNRQVLDIQGLAVIRIDYEGFIIYIHPYADIVQIGVEVDMGRIELEHWLLKNDYYDYGVAVIDKRVFLMAFEDITEKEILETYKLEIYVRQAKEKLRELVHQLPRHKK